MINKSKLWFITLSSVVLVLIVYYMIIPGENVLVFSPQTKEEAVKTNIEESESLTVMRINSEEKYLENIKSLQTILLDNSKNVDEKNEAYETIKYLNENKSIEEKLEKELGKEFSLNAFVELSDSSITVVLDNIDASSELANNIINYVNEKIDNSYYITVKFE